MYGWGPWPGYTGSPGPGAPWRRQEEEVKGFVITMHHLVSRRFILVLDPIGNLNGSLVLIHLSCKEEAFGFQQVVNWLVTNSRVVGAGVRDHQ